MWRDGLKTLYFTFTHHRYLNNEYRLGKYREHQIKKKLAIKQAQAVAVIMNNKALNKW